MSKNQIKILKMLIKDKNLNEYTRTPKKGLVKEIIKIKKKIISLTPAKGDTYQSVRFRENNKRQKTITNNYKTLSHSSISKIMSINAETRNPAWLLKNKGLKPYRNKNRKNPRKNNRLRFEKAVFREKEQVIFMKTRDKF